MRVKVTEAGRLGKYTSAPTSANSRGCSGRHDCPAARRVGPGAGRLNCDATPICLDCATAEAPEQITTEQVKLRLARIEQLLGSDPAAARSEASAPLEAFHGVFAPNSRWRAHYPGQARQAHCYRSRG